MKYTFESSETEVTELYGLLGLITKEIGKTVRHANELRASRRTSTVVSSSVDVLPDQDVDEKNADVIDFPRPVPMPVRAAEEEIEDNLFNEPEPYVPLAPASAPSREEAKLEKAKQRGRASFLTFIEEWLIGIDMQTMQLIEGVAQPDRAQMLRDLQNGPSSYGVLLFVKSCGGLQCAIAEVTGSQDLALALAPFIVPPASIAFSDLADTFEYANPFKQNED
jgi:hypothetical protein